MDLAITSLGMVTSVGLRADVTCAAIRAGLMAPGPIEHYQVLDPEAQKPTPLLGHPIRGFTDGFVFIGLWRRLAFAALEDLIRQGALPDASARSFWATTCIVAVTPRFDDDRFADDLSVAKDAPAILEAYLGDLGDLPLSPRHAEIVSLGHAGAAAAARLAEQRLASGFERVVLLGVDSCVDPFSLEWLSASGRLKIGDNPCGLSPGEAGACLLVERAGTARRRGAPVIAEIDAAAVGYEASHLFQEDAQNTGVALAEVIDQALGRPSPEAPFAGNIVIDLNGEPWRAAEWGCAQVRLGARLGAGARIVLPCASLGDVGAASGVVGVCVAARSLARGYAALDHVLVVSSDEHGHVGALRIRAPKPGR